MIQFNDWVISDDCSTPIIARQYDNLSCSLTVVGDLPDGWDWAMLVECSGNLNVIALSPVEGGVGAVLTDDMLALSGYYTMQLRGTQGEVVRHTNKIEVFIPESLMMQPRNTGNLWPCSTPRLRRLGTARRRSQGLIEVFSRF